MTATARVIRAADLFCGAGGTSTGLAHACRDLGIGLDLVAVNHWDVAIKTHTANHPFARHLCSDLDTVNPRTAVPSGRLDLMVASPECTHHSNARGGRPVTDQKRASAWHVLRWAEAIYVDSIIVENVREFREWGPVGVNGRPMKTHKGETYRAFLAALRSLGYRAEDRILNAADYGDPTTRERLFIMARRGGKRISWPEPSHSESPGLHRTTEPWKAARGIIDWSLPSQSIFERKRALSPATMKRIIAGLQRFGGPALEPFLVVLRGTSTVRSLARPVPAVTAQGQHLGLCEPFLLQQQSGGVARPVSRPAPTVAAKGAIGLVQPFLVPFKSERSGQGGRTHSVNEPLPTVASGGNFALAQPFILPPRNVGKDDRADSVDRPLRTITAAAGRCFGLVEPFILPPLGYHARGGMANKPRSLDAPLQTVTSRGGGHLVEPFLAKYYGTGITSPVSDPVPTLTAKDRLGLVTAETDGAVLDVHFRMLQPHELARAMSFDDAYHFEGNREQRVRQIGNAVPVNLARALCRALLE